MYKTIIHIGYPKTGTSWFTDFFYPDIRNAHISYNKDIFYETGDNEYFEVKHDGEPDEKGMNIIIAHKLSGLVDFVWDHGSYRDFFIKQMKEKYPDASIVIFIRNQIEFLASAYSSYLTHGGTYTFRKLFLQGRLGDESMFAFKYLDYYDAINLYKSHFADVKVFVYEEFMEDNVAFLNKYKDTFGFDVDIANLKFVKYNEKLRKGFAGLIRITNFLKKKGVNPKKYILNMPWLFAWMTKDRMIKYNYYRFWGSKLKTESVLGNDLIKYMKRYYRESNNKLISEFGLKSIEKYKYPL